MMFNSAVMTNEKPWKSSATLPVRAVAVIGLHVMTLKLRHRWFQGLFHVFL
jgi:hypothetical protein